MWVCLAVLLKVLVRSLVLCQSSDQWAKSSRKEMIHNASRLAICNRTVAPHLSSWKADLQNPVSLCVPAKVTFSSEWAILIFLFSKACVFLIPLASCVKIWWLRSLDFCWIELYFFLSFLVPLAAVLYETLINQLSCVSLPLHVWFCIYIIEMSSASQDE